jgi:hypothetical protein
MDNFFFRNTFPYKVEIKEHTIDVYNREYKLIGTYLKRKNITTDAIHDMAEPSHDCIRGNVFYFYDDDYPISANGLNIKKWESYVERLKKFLLIMQGNDIIINE